MTAATYRLQNEHNGRVWLAWNTAALSRARQLPSLNSLLVRRQSAEPQTWQEQLQIVRMITAAHNGTR